MADQSAPPESWDSTWEGARREVLKATMSLTPAQRLAWLEQALELALQTGALQRARERPDRPAAGQ